MSFVNLFILSLLSRLTQSQLFLESKEQHQPYKCLNSVSHADFPVRSGKTCLSHGLVKVNCQCTKKDHSVVYLVLVCAVSGWSEEEEAKLQQRGSLWGGVGRQRWHRTFLWNTRYTLVYGWHVAMISHPWGWFVRGSSVSFQINPRCHDCTTLFSISVVAAWFLCSMCLCVFYLLAT